MSSVDTSTIIDRQVWEGKPTGPLCYGELVITELELMEGCGGGNL